VKSALPTVSTALAAVSSPLLTTVSVTTVISASATAKAMPADRAFFAHRLAAMSDADDDALIAHLKLQIEKLRRELFGSRSERSCESNAVALASSATTRSLRCWRSRRSTRCLMRRLSGSLRMVSLGSCPV